jgi:hypothetical protein
MNTPNATIKKNFHYPPFLSTARKKWDNSVAHEMIPDDNESACKPLSERPFRIRKPLFYPLNYGNDGREVINGSNGDGQDGVAVRNDFPKGRVLLSIVGGLSLEYLVAGVSI